MAYFNKNYEPLVYDDLKFLVKPTTIMDPKNFYKLLYNWLVEKGYSLKDGNFDEVSYYQQERPGWKEIEYIWKAKKDHDELNRITFYIFVRIDGINQIETMFQGNKIKTTKATIEIEVKSKYIFDPDKKFAKSRFLSNKLIYNLFINYIYKHKLEEYKDDFGERHGQFQSFVLEIFNTFQYKEN